MGSRIVWSAIVAQSAHEDLEHFNDLISSWPVQLLVAGLYAALALLAFSRVAREWDDGVRRWFRAVAVGLAVFVLLMVVLGESVLGWIVWPVWLQYVLIMWLAGMCLYYMVRAMTRVTPGEGDPEAQRRGATLEQTLGEALDDAHRTAEKPRGFVAPPRG